MSRPDSGRYARNLPSFHAVTILIPSGEKATKHKNYKMTHIIWVILRTGVACYIWDFNSSQFFTTISLPNSDVAFATRGKKCAGTTWKNNVIYCTSMACFKKIWWNIRQIIYKIFCENFYGFRISYQCLFCRRCFHLFHNIFDVRYRGLRWIQCYRVAHRRQVFFFPMMLNPLLPFLLCQIQPKVFLKIDFNLGTINIFRKYFRVILTDTSLFCLPFISRTVSTPRLNLFFFGP